MLKTESLDPEKREQYTLTNYCSQTEYFIENSLSSKYAVTLDYLNNSFFFSVCDRASGTP